MKSVVNNRFQYYVNSDEVKHSGKTCTYRTPDHPFLNQAKQVNNINHTQHNPTHHQPTQTYNNNNVVFFNDKSPEFNSEPKSIYDLFNMENINQERAVEIYKLKFPDTKDSFIYINPIFEGNFQHPVVYDSGCEPEACIDKSLAQKFGLMKYKTGRKARIRTANNEISTPYDIILAPVTFRHDQVKDISMIVLDHCPCKILFGNKALENVIDSDGNPILDTIKQKISDISPEIMEPKN